MELRSSGHFRTILPFSDFSGEPVILSQIARRSAGASLKIILSQHRLSPTLSASLACSYLQLGLTHTETSEGMQDSIRNVIAPIPCVPPENYVCPVFKAVEYLPTELHRSRFMFHVFALLCQIWGNRHQGPICMRFSA